MSAARLLLIAIGLCVVAGCHDPTDVAQLVSVATDGAHFSLGTTGAVEVPFSVVNPGRETVYLAACGNRVIVAIDRWQDDRWVQYSGGGGACLAVNSMAPRALPPGGRYDGATSVPDAGQYRIRVGASTSETAEPEWRAASNAFTIE